jgi:predicted ArsR family transcriptional regulator
MSVQHSVLRYLQDFDQPVSVERIANYLGLTVSETAHALDDLEQDGDAMFAGTRFGQKTYLAVARR